MLTPMTQRLPVWPYFALALLSGVAGAVLLFHNLGSGAPPEEELQKVSGNVDKVLLIDDLSGEQTMLKTPMNSIHFTLKEVEGKFRYPSRSPGFTAIWERLAFHVDVWVRRSAIGGAEPMEVFRLEQQVPENWVAKPISIGYEKIAESHGRVGRSYIKVGAVLLAASAGFVVIALLVRVWDRRKRGGSPA